MIAADIQLLLTMLSTIVGCQRLWYGSREWCKEGWM